MHLKKKGRNLPTFLRNNKAIILIAALGLLLRIGFFIVVQPWNEQVLRETILVGDPDGYHNMALSLINSGSFSYQKYMPFEQIKADVSAERTPGYPLFVSFVYFLFGVKPWLVILCQLLINVGSLILIYILAIKVFDKKIALIAALLYAVEPHAITLSVAFMTDTLFTFAFLASMVIFIYGIENKRITLFLLFGFILGLSTLIRPITKFFPIMMIGLICIYPGINWPFRFKAVAGFIFVFMLAISPWLFRNYFGFNHFSLSSMQGKQLLSRYVAKAEADRSGKSLEQIKTELREIADKRGINQTDNLFDRSRIYSDIAKAYYIAHWKFYIPQHIVKGAMKMFLSPGTQRITNRFDLESEAVMRVLVGGFLAATYVAFFFGSVLMIYRRNYRFLIAILFVFLYFVTIIGPLGSVRFKAPLTPFYIIISAAGLFEIFRFTRSYLGKALRLKRGKLDF